MDLRLQPINFSGRKSWLLHCSGRDTDTFWRAAEHQVKFFSSAQEATEFAKGEGRDIEGEREAIDFEAVTRFGVQPFEPICGRLFYNAWNFFADLAATLDQNFSGYEHGGMDVHEELFWSSGLVGQAFSPDFTRQEMDMLRCVIREGVARLTGCWEREPVCALA